MKLHTSSNSNNRNYCIKQGTRAPYERKHVVVHKGYRQSGFHTTGRVTDGKEPGIYYFTSGLTLRLLFLSFGQWLKSAQLYRGSRSNTVLIKFERI